MFKRLLFVLVIFSIVRVNAQTAVTISGGTISGGVIGNDRSAEIQDEISNGVVADWDARYGVNFDTTSAPTNVVLWGDLTGHGHTLTSQPFINTSNAYPICAGYLTNKLGQPVQSMIFSTNDLSRFNCNEIAPLFGGTTNQSPFSMLLVVNTPLAGVDTYSVQLGNTTSGSNNKNWIILRPNAGGGNRSWACSMASQTNNIGIITKTIFLSTFGNTNRWCCDAVSYDPSTGNMILVSNNDTNNTQVIQFGTNSVFNTFCVGDRNANTFSGKKYLGAIARLIVSSNTWSLAYTTNKVSQVIRDMNLNSSTNNAP